LVSADLRQVERIETVGDLPNLSEKFTHWKEWLDGLLHCS
jgi:hypothetical protein